MDIFSLFALFCHYQITICLDLLAKTFIMIAFIKQFMSLFMNCLLILVKIAKSFASIAETWLEMQSILQSASVNLGTKTKK